MKYKELSKLQILFIASKISKDLNFYKILDLLRNLAIFEIRLF